MDQGRAVRRKSGVSHSERQHAGPALADDTERPWSRHGRLNNSARRYQPTGQLGALAEALLFCVFSLPVREPRFDVFEQLRQCDSKRNEGSA